VAVAALKFADLLNFRGTSYVFDLDRFSSFEGKTGPYLLYQAVRVKSLLRRAAAEGAEPGADRRRRAGRARPGAALDAFDHALAEAYDKRAPNFIAEHAYPPGPGLLEVLRRLPGPDRRARRRARAWPWPLDHFPPALAGEAGASPGPGAEGATAPETLRQKDRAGLMNAGKQGPLGRRLAEGARGPSLEAARNLSGQRDSGGDRLGGGRIWPAVFAPPPEPLVSAAEP
jgi:hypothetical protein